MIELKRNVMMFTILAAGAVYFLYDDLRAIFMPVPQASDEISKGYIGRKLLTLDSNVNKDSLKLKTELNPLIEDELKNGEKIKGISKSFISYNKVERKKIKKLSRRKRSARHNDLGWKLSLNVTNNKNPSKRVSNFTSEDNSPLKLEKENFLNMAVQMEGASPDNSFKELHQAWDSLGLLLRRLYGKNASSKENARDIATEMSTESDDLVSPDSPMDKPERERAPKFIFGLLNFGNSENPPLDGTTLGDGDFSESATSPKTNIAPMEGPTSTKASLGTNATESSIEAFGLEELISEKPTVSITETFMDFESISSEFNTQSVEKFEKTSAGSIRITTVKPEPSFTSEQLKEFCISLLSRIQVSPKSVEHFSGEDGSGELSMMGIGDEETINSDQSPSTDVLRDVTTKSTNQRFGMWASIWNRFVGRRLIQNPIDASLQSMIPKDILEKAKDGNNEAFGSKSESSTVLGTFDSTASDKDFTDEDESALTVPDCESFFRQIQNDAVFSKPNLLDIINNPILLSLDPSQFNFTEIHDDNQMRSMKSGTDSNLERDFFTEEITNGLNTPFSNNKSTVKEFSEFPVDKQPNKLSGNTVSNQDSFTTSNSFDTQESFRSGTFNKLNVNNLITENAKEARNLAIETILSDKFTTMQIQSSTGILDNELFIQPDVQERTNESSEIPSSKDINDRIFGMLNLGSGERSLEDSDDLTTQNISEFSENQSLHPDLINFESSDLELNETFSLNRQEISTDSVAGPNIFDVILNLRKGESLMNQTESDHFDVNKRNQQIENKSTIPSVENPLQFEPKEKPTKSQNVSDPTKILPMQSISEDQTPSQGVFDEKQNIEFQFDLEEKFTESPNVILDSTNTSVTKFLSEDKTFFQNILDEGSGDEENRIFPGLMNVFGSGDGRELSEIPIDPELNSNFSECPDCISNKSNSFSFEDYDDCGSDINDTAMLIGETSTTINPLSNRIVSDAPIYDDATYLGNKDAFSEFIQDPSEFSTLHSLKSSISSPAPEIINYENYDSSENIGYEKTNYEYHNYGYEITTTAPLEHVHIEGECDESHFDTKTDAFSEFIQDPSEFSTFHSLKSPISSPAPEITNHENYHNYEKTNYEYHYSENYGYEITTIAPLEHVHIEGEFDESNFDTKMDAFSESPTGAAAVPEDLRFMDTLFLTGSGAGGLFGNDNSEINFVQEPDTTSFPFPLSPVTPRQSRRGGRMDDAFFAEWPAENEEHGSERHFDLLKPQNPSDSPKGNSHDTNVSEKSLQTAEKEKGVGTDYILPLTTVGYIQSMEDRFNIPNTGEDTTRTLQSFSNETTSTPASSFVIPKKKAKDLPPRYCNHAGECNVASNEGCITKKGRGVCDCRRSFVRHPETDVCEAPFMLKTSLKLPGEIFHEDLRDKYSELYQNKTRDAIETMWLVVYQDPTLEYNLANIDVSGFEKGSLVIHWELIFAVKKNESISVIVREVDEKLEETFKHQAVLKSAPLNVENAKLLSYQDINACEKKELNYCSKDADCIREEYRGFRCRCKDGYLDSSKDPMYPGEICIAACPPNYCGENGYCEVRSNGAKQCLCNGWYFGKKCSVSGILVISCFAGANAVFIALALAIVFICKRRRQRGTRFYENNQIMFQPNRETGPFGRVSPRLAASIALDEMGPTKPSKYMAISTPLFKPDIQITSPSIIGSSISYDYDSTFDRTPSAEVKMEPPKYDTIHEAPKYDSAPEV